MGKKTTRAEKKQTLAATKAELKLRFDQEVFEGIKKLADGADISVNQLMHGLARWAIKNGQPGEGVKSEGGSVSLRRQPGCVFFGNENYEAVINEDGDTEFRNGTLIFNLDFTERHVIREE